MTIEFGISSFGDVESPTGCIPHAQRLQEIIEEMKITDKVGLDIYAIGEHHRKDYAVSSPDTVLAAGAAVTENVRLSTAVTVLSSEDPVRVWERFATIDGISNGRAEIMAGRGSFIESFPLFGYDLNDYEQLFEEKLALLVELQKGHRDKLPITFRGELQHSVENITVISRYGTRHTSNLDCGWRKSRFSGKSCEIWIAIDARCHRWITVSV